jgi:hypothetical protein
VTAALLALCEAPRSSRSSSAPATCTVGTQYFREPFQKGIARALAALPDPPPHLDEDERRALGALGEEVIAGLFARPPLTEDELLEAAARRARARPSTPPGASQAQGTWLGPLEPVVDGKSVVFERGFLARCTPRFRTARQRDELLGHPAWSTVRELVGVTDASLALAPAFARLRRLHGIDAEGLAALSSQAPPLALEAVALVQRDPVDDPALRARIGDGRGLPRLVELGVGPVSRAARAAGSSTSSRAARACGRPGSSRACGTSPSATSPPSASTDARGSRPPTPPRSRTSSPGARRSLLSSD